MFGKKAEMVAVMIPEPEVPAPQPALENRPEGTVDLNAYNELADQAGFSNGALLEMRFRHFCQQHEICIFPYAKVTQFLDAKLEAAKKANEVRSDRRWGWKPLRAQDVSRFTDEVRYDQNGGISRTQYHGRVPKSALTKVGEIMREFPQASELAFYVSDYVAPTPDPFLAVTGEGMPLLVIHHWDEPDFRL